MSKQINKFTAVALGAAGAGAALALTNKHRQENAKRENLRSGGTAEYRNTERGKSEKNSKGIRYTAGNYEAFVRPEKPEGVEEKHAYIVGSGLAALAAALVMAGRVFRPAARLIAWAGVLTAVSILSAIAGSRWQARQRPLARVKRSLRSHSRSSGQRRTGIRHLSF